MWRSLNPISSAIIFSSDFASRVYPDKLQTDFSILSFDNLQHHDFLRLDAALPEFDLFRNHLLHRLWPVEYIQISSKQIAAFFHSTTSSIMTSYASMLPFLNPISSTIIFSTDFGR
jgi:hypothetical protein